MSDWHSNQKLGPSQPQRDVLLSAWRRNHGNLPPPRLIRYATPELPSHHDNLSRLRQQLLESCENYVLNYLPTHILRISTMTLATRAEFWEAEKRRVERELVEDLQKRVLAESKSGSSDLDPPILGDDVAETKTFGDKYIRKLFKFAIFSHRWGADEPHFHDISERSPDDDFTVVGEGYVKLLHFCEKARDDFNCEYVWSDTCCINKESSVELDEAIRSMYRWYSIASVCIVHLAQSISVDDFPSEPWFTRGWTLQELLAPQVIRFYGKDWKPISREENVKGDKAIKEIWTAIESVTEISRNDLWHFLPSCDRVAEKMVWASKRRTTKIEDVAYSLLGLFDISMPIAYGEVERAWYRFMGAIASACSDASFFAWAGKPSPYSRAFPSSPACYLRLDPGISTGSFHRRHPSYEVTKLGVLIKLLLVPIRYTILEDENGREVGLSVTPHNLESFLVGADIPHGGMEDYMLGIVNFRTKDDEGFVLNRDECHCLVLSRSHTDGVGWIKMNTECVVIVRCVEDIRQKCEVVLLYHAGGYDGDLLRRAYQYYPVVGVAD